ncbi:MAG TPA: hypothetical protein VHG10_00410 [Glycomyces sp.]|nr:hypothetical protein [Glycomyces sp.]
MVEAEVPDVRVGLPAYALEVGTEPLAGPARNSLGGWPFLAEGRDWPECFCGERMALFFQIELPLDLGPFGGDQLAVFHCRIHNDFANPPVAEGRLVDRFWEAAQSPDPGPFWSVLLQRHLTLPAEDVEPLVRALPLMLRAFADELDEYGLGTQEFKVGGAPSWAQDPESYRCACGADLVYLCQVPEDWEFDVYPGSPKQPNGVGETFHLFLGNEVYLLACPAHCDPAAVWPVNQN